MNKFLQYLIISIVGLLPAHSFSQVDFNWENKIPTLTPIPDSLKNEAAVVISYTENRKIVKEKSFINTIITLRKKIKIQSNKAIAEHSFFRIKQSQNMLIEILDARTIKPNGVILDVESSEIKSIESKSQLKGKSKDLFFAIPGISIGDEVEMICRYSSSNFPANDFIYFHQSVPVLKSTFSIEVPKKVIVKSNVYSGLDLPKVRHNLYSNTISWTSGNNSKNQENINNPLYSFPHLIYQLEYRNFMRLGIPSSFNNWHHLISYFEKTAFKPKIRNHKLMNHLWAEISQGETDSNELIQRIHDYLNQHITITEIHPNEMSKGIEFFINEKKADQPTLLKMYFALLDKVKIKAKIAVGQSKSIGPIDLKIPTTAQISNFIVVAENQGTISLLVPKDESMQFPIDVLPQPLHNTDLYMTSSRKRRKLMKIRIPNPAE